MLDMFTCRSCNGGIKLDMFSCRCCNGGIKFMFSCKNCRFSIYREPEPGLYHRDL